MFCAFQMPGKTASSLVWALVVLALSPFVRSHRGHEHGGAQLPLLDVHDFAPPASSDATGGSPPWLEKYGAQIDQPFSGPLSFSHLPYSRCLEDENAAFDIAVLGMPFDTAVTYRPGARFGPYAIRSGSRRQRETRGYTLAWKNNPYELGSRIMDCGDVRAVHLRRTYVVEFTCLARSGPREPVRQCAGGGPDGGRVLDALGPISCEWASAGRDFYHREVLQGWQGAPPYNQASVFNFRMY